MGFESSSMSMRAAPMEGSMCLPRFCMCIQHALISYFLRLSRLTLRDRHLQDTNVSEAFLALTKEIQLADDGESSGGQSQRSNTGDAGGLRGANEASGTKKGCC
jgi:hypothetical protein